MGKNTEKDMRERREIFDLATNKKKRGRGKVKSKKHNKGEKIYE